MAPQPETPEWWRDRLYKKLRKRLPLLRDWDNWYVGEHPAPMRYEKAEALMQRLLETVGLNMLAVVTNASLERQHIEGFRLANKSADDLWAAWQSNNMDFGSTQVHQTKQSLSAAYVLVDPNRPNRREHPTITPEHPEQAITESYPGEIYRRVGFKAWADDITGTIQARVYMDNGDVVAYAAPTRIHSGWTLTGEPKWEYQESASGTTELDACALVPFLNQSRLLADPLPEFHPAIKPQRRLNKTLLDRMAMQDQGAFKAWWATGLQLERDPQTGKPTEPLERSVDRLLVNEDPSGKFGQMEAEDIKQILEAVKEDVIACAIMVPTPPDQFLGQLVNVAEGGLLVAQSSLVSRVRRHQRQDEESWEEVGRLVLRGMGKESLTNDALQTVWRNAEFRTETEKAQAGMTAKAAGVPDEVVWGKYFDATPLEISQWTDANDQRMRREASIGVKAIQDAAAGGA